MGKEGELKNTGCLSIQFFLREFYQEWAQQSFILFCFILFFKGWGGGGGGGGVGGGRGWICSISGKDEVCMGGLGIL